MPSSPAPPRPWPRLSEDLPYPRRPDTCQACGVIAIAWTARDVVTLRRWEEHDDADRPARILVVLCDRCSRRLVDPHPRLYRALERHEPWPGGMSLCIACRHRAPDVTAAGVDARRRGGLGCTHPDLRANGGAGLELTMPAPTRVHLCGGRGGWRMLYAGPVTACAGREALEPSAPVGCARCGHLSCVCRILEVHQEGCAFRRAATCTTAIECEHGRDVCPICDPCTCEASARAAPAE